MVENYFLFETLKDVFFVLYSTKFVFIATIFSLFSKIFFIYSVIFKRRHHTNTSLRSAWYIMYAMLISAIIIDLAWLIQLIRYFFPLTNSKCYISTTYGLDNLSGTISGYGFSLTSKQNIGKIGFDGQMTSDLTKPLVAV